MSGFNMVLEGTGLDRTNVLRAVRALRFEEVYGAWPAPRPAPSQASSTLLEGLMLHQDGSTHEWVRGRLWDLIVTSDDATGRAYSGFCVEEEGTWSSFRGVRETVEDKKVFASSYGHSALEHDRQVVQGSAASRLRAR